MRNLRVGVYNSNSSVRVLLTPCNIAKEVVGNTEACKSYATVNTIFSKELLGDRQAALKGICSFVGLIRIAVGMA